MILDHLFFHQNTEYMATLSTHFVGETSFMRTREEKEGEEEEEVDGDEEVSDDGKGKMKHLMGADLYKLSERAEIGYMLSCLILVSFR